ncbi:MAG: dienelactone hydrolase family protein [Chthoniobacterales bacterium]
MRLPLLLSILILSTFAASAQDDAKTRLEKSPRHGEWVEFSSGSRKIKAFVVYPQTKNKATVVLVIHEIFGLTDWIRGVCDQLAEAGYIAIAPDMLSGPTHQEGDEARKAISELKPEQIESELNATADYAMKLPAANGKLAVAGFCWGGGQAFLFAEENAQLKASFVFYGAAPPSADMSKISGPVYAFYGENDARITTTVPDTEKAMKAAGKTYDPVIYSGAGHGFMRLGEAADAPPANRKAMQDSWKRLKSLLKTL